jgi:hypothetical protein
MLMLMLMFDVWEEDAKQSVRVERGELVETCNWADDGSKLAATSAPRGNGVSDVR